ncbi:hypothetical protein [Micromonospora sp. NPDC049799]|uniref:hypothetical protein n=1 Tax=Micromonospora sp. NPDC049799 TaxID=3154741 RepID=UPI0033D04FB0
MTLAAAWETAVGKVVDEAGRMLADGLLPERDAALLLAALGRLTVGGDDSAGRAPWTGSPSYPTRARSGPPWSPR